MVVMLVSNSSQYQTKRTEMGNLQFLRSYKTSSEDFVARVKLEWVRQMIPFELEELYCFNSPSSYDRIEGILKETDAVAQPIIDAMLGRLDKVCQFYIKTGKG